MSLTELPDELLVNILQRLKTVDIANVRLTNWRLNHIVQQRKLDSIDANYVSICPDYTTHPMMTITIQPEFTLPNRTAKIFFKVPLRKKTANNAIGELLDKVKSTPTIFFSDIAVNDGLIKVVSAHPTIVKEVNELGIHKCTGAEATIHKLVDLLTPNRIISTSNMFKQLETSKTKVESCKRSSSDEYIYYTEHEPKSKSQPDVYKNCKRLQPSQIDIPIRESFQNNYF